MIHLRNLFETHLTVSNLSRSMAFFGEVLKLELAQAFPERRVAFYWIGGRGKSMLGLWEVGTVPQRMSLHLALTVDLPDLLEASQHLRATGIVPRDFSGHPTDEPIVLAWMPAASLYFHDPDGNVLEFIAMLPESPQPELGIVGWSCWNQIHESAQGPMV